MSTLKNVFLYTLSAVTLASCGSSPAEKLTHENTNAPKQANANQDSNFDINKVSQALDLESIIKGIREGAAGKPSPMTEQEYEKAMGQLQQQAVSAVSEKNLDAAEKFMKDNVHAKGVVEIIPGKLQYTILEEGKDPAVVEHGTPQITYVGKYIDGTVFGNSDAAGGPITVPLDQTIPGFSKGIVGMKEGEKRRLFVHPEVGYGTSGQLLPNSLLIFDIEVIKATSPEKDSAESFHGDASDYSDDGQANDSNDQEPRE
jgi:peptidylprolyl isomerase